MGKKIKTQLPSSTAGLVRYFDDYKEAIQVKPESIVIVTVFIITAIVFLRFYMGY